MIPVLLATMAQQEDGQDEDSYNKSTEAAACLGLVATIIENQVVGFVMPWVEQCIASQDWRQREAAVLAFGCIMDGKGTLMSGIRPSDTHTHTHKAMRLMAFVCGPQGPTTRCSGSTSTRCSLCSSGTARALALRRTFQSSF